MQALTPSPPPPPKVVALVILARALDAHCPAGSGHIPGLRLTLHHNTLPKGVQEYSLLLCSSSE